jgi:hypothetical protein
VTGNIPSDLNYSAYLNHADNRIEDCEWYFDFCLAFMLFLPVKNAAQYPRSVSLKRGLDPQNLYSSPTSVQAQ